MTLTQIHLMNILNSLDFITKINITSKTLGEDTNENIDFFL